MGHSEGANEQYEEEQIRILCIDQATRSGWSFGIEHSQERYLFGSFRMPKRDAPGERLVIFRDGLEELIIAHRPDILAYESPFVPVGQQGQQPEKGPGPRRAAFNVNTIKFLLNLEGVLLEVASRHDLTAEHYPSSSWRVTALGMGRLPPGAADAGMDFKKMMKTKARQLGYEVADDNEADAIGILIHMLNGPPAAARQQGDLLAMAGSGL